MFKSLWHETLLAIIAVLLIIIAFIIDAFTETTTTLVVGTFALAFLIGGYHKAKEGIIDTIKSKRLNVEFLMIFAALAAFIIGKYSEGAILILIFSISGVLESYANAKSEKALKQLLNLAPDTAVLYENGETKSIPLDEVVQGNRLMVKVGEKVPADGIIKEGNTAVDQAAITGEFVPAYKHVGDKVFAGAINIEGSIIIEATASAKESVIQKVVAFIEKAKEDQPTSNTKIKRFESVYVYVVLAIAALMVIIPPWFGWLSSDEALYRGIVVLVVGSPCALVASVAPAALSALSNASRKHILIKGGSRLEGVNAVSAVVFDKTGTITTGEPKVVGAQFDSDDMKYCMRVVLTLESQSNHPLAKAVVKSYDRIETLQGVYPQEKPGYGMEATIDNHLWQVGRFDCTKSAAMEKLLHASSAEGNTHILIIKDQVLVAFIALKDTLRPSVKTTIKRLKDRGIHTIMMTGDNATVANELAKAIQIDTVYADCFPEDKVDIIKQTKKDYHSVLMVGDGINDAPALNEADVSIAMGSATDVSLETSDIVFMDDNMGSLEQVFTLAKRLKGIVAMNIALSVMVIATLMIANLFGVVQLPFGVLIHEMSTILVVLNSLRLLMK